MKVLHVTKKYPNALGGDAVVVSNLEKQQKSNGHQVIILTSNCDSIINTKNVYKFGLKDTPSNLDNITPKRLISLCMLFLSSFRILKIEHPDIIHTHSVDMAFFISFAARLYNIPVVHTFHIVTFYDNSQSPVRRKTELLLVRGARVACITAPNAFDVKKLKAAKLKNVTLVPNGVDLNFWENDPKTKKESEFTFITVGRLEEQKGYVYLIKAAAKLRTRSKKKFRVIIVGEGSLKSEFERMVKSLHLDSCVELVGKKNQNEIRRLYSSSHVAIYPSLYEAMSLSLLEAWAMQLPVIATRVGILRDSDNSDLVFLAKLRSEVSLENAMQKLIMDRQLMSELSENGTKKVKELSWPNVYHILDGVYGGVVTNGK